MQSTILVILHVPPWAVFRYLSPSLRRFCLYQHSISQRTVNNPRQTRICYIFRLWIIIKALLNKMSLYLRSHFPIRIIVLKCPDNKSARNQPKSCVPAMQNYTNHNDARPILFQLKCSLPFRLFLFVWRLETVPPLNLYYDISIAEDLHCLKAVDRIFVRNGGTTRTYSSLCSRAGVSEQIANNVLFWLRLSKI